MRRHFGRKVGVAALLGLGALTACGGGGGGGGVATLGDGKATTTTAAKAGGGGDRRDAALRFARCMREHGVDIPDPAPGGNGAISLAPGQGANPDDPKFAEAHKACQQLLGDLGPGDADPAQRQRFQDMALAFARCMREQGIDMPDPTVGEGGRVQQVLGNPDDPRFKAAEQACRKHMPVPPGEEG